MKDEKIILIYGESGSLILLISLAVMDHSMTVCKVIGNMCQGMVIDTPEKRDRADLTIGV